MKNVFFTFLTTLFFLTSAHAQWTEDTNANTMCTQNDALDMQAIGTNSGETYIVFWRNQPSPVVMDLRVQLLDVDGYPQFGPDGMLISNGIPMSTYTVLWSVAVDDQDNLYVGVTGTGGGNPVRVFKIQPDGSMPFGSSGINVGNGNDTKLLPLSSGELLVSWLADSGGKANVQRYDEDGNALWDAPLQVLLGSSSTSADQMFEMSDGDFIMVFHQHLGFGINSQLYAQRYGMDKTARWSTPTHLSNLGTVWNRSYSNLQIGDNVYYGYHASSGTRFDSYLQRLNPDGSLPWGINGVDFNVNQTDYEMETRIAHQDGSPYIWAVCSYTTPSQGPGGDYVQKYDAETGERFFTNFGLEVFPIGSGKIHYGDLQVTSDDEPVFIFSSDVTVSGFVMELSSVQLNADGEITEGPEAIADFNAEKRRIALTKMVNNQSVAVFVEDKDGSEKVYAQRVLGVVSEEEGYCIPERDVQDGPGGVNPYKVDAITEVQLEALNDSEESSNSYVDNTETAEIPELMPGQSYTLTISGNGAGSHYGAAWIDYDNSLSFEQSELLGIETANAPGTVEINFTVPETADLGQYRLRVLWQFSENTPEIPDPCTEDNWGQTKDYTVELIEQPPFVCPEPEDLAVDGVTTDSAEIMWEPGDDPTGMQFEVIYGESGFDPDTEGVSVITDDPVMTLENLTADTSYDVYVRALCSEDEHSEWIGPETFTTEPLPMECLSPTDLSVVLNTAAENSVIVSWNAGGGESMWAINYGEEGFTEDDDFETQISVGTTAVVNNLDPDMYYDFYVTAVCDLSNMVISEPAGPVTFRINDLSVEMTEFIGFAYYPNPVADRLQLQAKSPIELVEVYTVTGQKVISAQPHTAHIHLPLESLPAGIYAMKVTLNGTTQSFKIIKE